MVAVLVTELERAIIDKIRMGHISFQTLVCLNYGLPWTEEGLKYQETVEKRLEIKLGTDAKTRQKKAMQDFINAGYGDVAEIGKGKTRPHLMLEKGGVGK